MGFFAAVIDIDLFDAGECGDFFRDNVGATGAVHAMDLDGLFSHFGWRLNLVPLFAPILEDLQSCCEESVDGVGVIEDFSAAGFEFGVFGHN